MDGVNECVAGMLSGMVGKVIEFPLDTVKTRIQDVNSKYKGALDCLIRLGKEEGIRGYYRGVCAPVLGAMAENVVLFSVYGRFQGCYRSYYGLPAGEDMPLLAKISCGAVSGAAVAHILSPVELIKCRMQLQNTLPPGQQRYKNAIDCFAQTTRKDGPTALFKGHTATLAREIPGNMAWFGFYESACLAMTPLGKTKADLGPLQYGLAGGIAGVSYWTAFFPADVVKTRMQVSEEYAKLGLRRGLARLYRTEGIRGMYTGLGVTNIRAFPNSAAIFLVYETVMDYLNFQS